MSDWVKGKLSDVATIYSGYAFKGKDMNNESGIPLIKIKNINFSRVSKKCDSFLNKEAFTGRQEKYKLLRGDILVAMTGQGSVGRIGKMRGIDKTYLVNQRVGIVRVDKALANAEYVYQYMGRKSIESIYYSLAMGAGQPNLSPADIGNLTIYYPPLPTQQKIAKILSNYDDLIENNLKRIKLLEESARLTYEEWFLRFRIDGKKLEIDPESDLPFGWEFQNMYNLYEIKYGQNLPQTKIKESGAYEVYGASGIMGYHSQKNVSKKVALITSRGNGSSDIHRTYGESFVTNNSFIVRSKNKNLGLNFTLHHLETVGLINYCSGSAQPQLTNDAMKNIKIKLPDKELLIKFNNFAEPLIEVSDNLRNQNQLLKEARDILLPRLMTGMIDTDDMDIAV